VELARKLIENNTYDIFIIIDNLWEISIKTALGKLYISNNYSTIINDVTENNIEILPISFDYTVI